MANERHPRLTPSGFEQAAPVRARRWPWVLGMAAVVLIGLAWFEGGEEPLRPIAEEIPLPEQAQ